MRVGGRTENGRKGDCKLLRERVRWAWRGVKGWAKGASLGLTGLKRSDERAAIGDAQSETGAGARGGSAGTRHGCAAEMLRLRGAKQGSAAAGSGASGVRGKHGAIGGSGLSSLSLRKKLWRRTGGVGALGAGVPRPVGGLGQSIDAAGHANGRRKTGGNPVTHTSVVECALFQRSLPARWQSCCGFASVRTRMGAAGQVTGHGMSGWGEMWEGGAGWGVQGPGCA